LKIWGAKAGSNPLRIKEVFFILQLKRISDLYINEPRLILRFLVIHFNYVKETNVLSEKDSRAYNFLVIEDNSGDYILIEDYIMEYILSPNIVHVRSFNQAKTLLNDAIPCTFDLIMLDLTLPDKVGAELIADIVNLCPESPIIVLTGYTDFEFGVKSLSLGASDYLLKDELSPSSLYKSIIYNIERKKTHLELEESQKRYSDLFHLSPDPMWVYNVESQQFMDVNAAAIREYGYSQEEFLSMKIAQLQPENTEGGDDIHHELKLSHLHKTCPKDTFRHRKKNGDIIFVENQTSQISFHGKPAKILVAHDITERINYIDAIEKQNERFSEISWIQSHVVRAPIARLMGLIGLIKHPGSSEDLKVELLGYVLDSANELDDIVREITLKAEENNLRNSKGL